MTNIKEKRQSTDDKATITQTVRMTFRQVNASMRDEGKIDVLGKEK